jgi:hypothetical protein|tara:strand:+ start:1039 stop:1320 length:282 start_codon:yes stop_codon:yes gene_type:complete
MSDMTPDVSALVESLKASITAPEKQEMLEAIAADAGRLATLSFTDPAAAEAEVLIVKATMANLGQAEAATAVKKMTEWVTDTASRFVSKVMPV